MFRKISSKFLTGDDGRLKFGRIIKEGAVVSVTEYVVLGSFVLVNILINRFYGTEPVGVYTLSYSIAQIGIMGIGSVFSLLMRRDLSLDQYDANKYVSKIQILRSGNLMIVLMLGAAIIIFFYPLLRPNLLLILLMIAAKGFDALSETFYTAYQTLDRLGEYSLFKVSNAVAFIGISLFICFNRFDITYLYLGQVLCAVLMFFVNFLRWYQTKDRQEKKARHEDVDYRFLLVESFPLMVNAMIFQLGVRANNILIFDKLGEKELGIFSIIVITIGVFAGVANTMAIVFFGRLSKSFANDPKVFFRRLHQTIALFLVLGVSLFVLYLMVIPVIQSLFGLTMDYDLYRIMSSAIPFMFVASCLGAVFTIIKKQKIGMYLSGGILLFNLLVYVAFTERFGLVGAAYAFLITAIFQCLLIYLVALVVLNGILRRRQN